MSYITQKGITLLIILAFLLIANTWFLFHNSIRIWWFQPSIWLLNVIGIIVHIRNISCAMHLAEVLDVLLSHHQRETAFLELVDVADSYCEWLEGSGQALEVIALSKNLKTALDKVKALAKRPWGMIPAESITQDFMTENVFLALKTIRKALGKDCPLCGTKL